MSETERPGAAGDVGDAAELPVLDLSDDENENWLRTVRRRREQQEAGERARREPDDDAATPQQAPDADEGSSSAPRTTEEAMEGGQRKGRCWGIKLGSGGSCVPFCEQRKIVGVGWHTVDRAVLTSASWHDLAAHMKEVCSWYKNRRDLGMGVGQLHRFARECAVGDYVVYYDPPKKHVRICRVTSGPLRRDFDLDAKEDIWNYRRVEYPIDPVPILDFYGALKGRLLGPRMSFWDMRAFDEIDQIARGLSPNVLAASDPELLSAVAHLRDLLVHRAEALDEKDWEWLVVDYFKAQGAQVDERLVGGSRPLIDAEARFDHGELGFETWRIQVKRWHRQKVDWPTIRDHLDKIGDARFCFVSVYGFTDEARARADEDDVDVRLMEAGDFAGFLLTGKVRERIRLKLKLPPFAVSPTVATE